MVHEPYESIGWINDQAPAINQGNLGKIDEELIYTDRVANLANVINGSYYIANSYIKADGSFTTNSSNRYRTDYIPCKEGVSVTYAGESNRDDICGIAFYDINKNFISGYKNNGDRGTEITVTSPENTAYCALSTINAILAQSFIRINSGGVSYTFDKVINKLNNEISDAMEAVEGKIVPIMQDNLIEITSANYLTSDVMIQRSGVTESGNQYTIAAGGYLFSVNAGIYVYGAFLNYLRIRFELVSRNISTTTIRARIYNGNSGGSYKVFTSTDGLNYELTLSPSDFSSTDAYIQIRFDNRNNTESIVVKNLVMYMDKTYIGLQGQSTSETYYVSVSGNDNNDGSKNRPFATVNKALSSGASTILVYGGRYTQTINLNNATKSKISIRSFTENQKAVFLAPNSFICNADSTVSGYANVHQCSYSGSAFNGHRLYQENVPDESTLISDAERNPYERGQAYRCLDTKIVQCSADNLNDALVEINDISSGYKYYHDSANNKLYFSRPHEVSADYPIMRSMTASFLSGNTRAFEVSFYGIECRYMSFNVNNITAHLEDCKAAYSYGAGCFRYDKSISSEFVRCEACSAHNTGGTGDGFNGHSESTGDIYSKQTTVRLVDCWSHDCSDDGYSDHERSEIEIWGGLFEYNGKGGVTPSYGSHCSCYNVLSRRNYNGFLYTGQATVEEGGKYGQLMCFLCVAENNLTNDGAGFQVRGTGNLAKLINCKSIGNKVGYLCAENTIMELIDCGEKDNTSIKEVLGTLVVNNTNIVTAN